MADMNRPMMGTVALGSVTGATGAKVWVSGSCATARTGPGVYTLTLSEPCAAGECKLNLTLNAASGIIRYAHTSATVKTVSTFAVDGTTATDKDFDFEVILAVVT